MDAWTEARYTGTRHWLIFMLVLLMLVMVQFFSLVPLLPLSEGNMSFATYFFVILVILLKGGRKMQKPTKRQLRPMFLLLFGVLLSFIPAYVYFHQSAVQSFFTYRRFFCFLTYPVLLAVRPTKTEFRRALYIFTGLWLVFSILVTFYLQGWIYYDEDSLFVGEGDYLHTMPGGRFLCLAFIFSIDRYRETRHTKDLLNAVFVFICVFLIVSRTILAASLLIIILATTGGLRTVRSRVAGFAILLVFFVIFLYLARAQLGMLITETSTQVADMDYNRNKALVYMFTSQRGWLTVLLGNGFVSGHVSSIVHDLQAQGIYNCDVGLVGMWQEFGLIPFFVILASAILALSRDYSFIVRASGLFICVSSLTIAYFGFPECMFWLSLHWMLMDNENQAVVQLRAQRKAERALRRQRYRSIAE